MRELDENIKMMFDAIVTMQNSMKLTDEEKEEYGFNYYEGKEKIEESEEYLKFYEEYKNIYSNEKWYYIYRIDKIINLFKKYLYVDGEIGISSNISMYDYVRIAKLYFEFLINNYFGGFYGGYSKLNKENNKNFNIETFKNKIEELYNLKQSVGVDFNTKQEIDFKDDYYEEMDTYSYLAENLINIWNPFDKKMISDLIKLYYIINERKKEISDFIMFKCIEYNAVDEGFEILFMEPKCINSWIISNVNSTLRARLIYNILQDFVIKFDYYNNRIDDYYNEGYAILEMSNDRYLKELITKCKKTNISKCNKLEDKVAIFQTFEKNIIEKLGIEGTYGDCYSEIFYNYNNNINITSKDYDISFDEILENSDNINYDTEISFEEENDGYNHVLEDHATENKLRIFYQKSKGFFEELSLELYSFSVFRERFDSLSDLSKLLEESQEVYKEYEIKDLSSYFDNYVNDNYDSNKAVGLLKKDLEKLNISDIDAKMEELLKNSKIRKTLLSASYWWNVFENTQDMSIDKDGQDYTPVVANYFKAVEILLYKKIKDASSKCSSDNIQLLPIYKANGARFNINEENDLTLGEMIKYIKRENKIINKNCDNVTFAETLLLWSDNVRNSHFHKDLITSKAEALELKKRSIKIIDEILYSFI